ncbi:peptidoglycan-binding protein [Radiobacillus kanasensis]|uniref:peptidoglycan-binding domain-containing protein n=1 Tax=Radiobacillus kanasensis TaxID=2844358 RepID=UPI001E4024B2|nr:peptidoglycan-binding protein [Radiobacillus kanasensis]UFU01348.1 peptidoglycan-binding protein [Radiobacillus kanasensis]
MDIGDEGPFVKEVQQGLIRAGFALPVYGADGIYGEETKRAVMKFQRRYGLTVDGLVGPQTLDKLSEVRSSSRPLNDFPLPNGIFRRGDQGPGVRQLQRALQRLNFDPQIIDGIYGPLTENAVRRFQSMFADLQNDGIYGPNTRRFLEMELSEL